MKHIAFHKHFVKEIRKCSPKVKKMFQRRRDMFLYDDTNPLLNIHELHGKYKGYKSFNVSADLRVIYKELGKDTYLFVTIGSHSELYS